MHTREGLLDSLGQHACCSCNVGIVQKPQCHRSDISDLMNLTGAQAVHFLPAGACLMVDPSRITLRLQRRSDDGLGKAPDQQGAAWPAGPAPATAHGMAVLPVQVACASAKALQVASGEVPHA